MEVKMKRVFMVSSLLIILVFMIGCERELSNNVYEDTSYWTDNYFQQKSVITPEPGNRTIDARVDGVWQQYELQNFPESFMEWNTERRIAALDRFRRMERPELAGPHNGIVATCGIKRGDTQFKLNNAVKGMGFVPKYEKIPELLELLERTRDDEFEEKLDVLQYLYENAEELFDLDKQGSLELYSVPEFETQSFLNQMTNPISTIVFLDIPSFKLKTIARLLHPNDPDLNDYEKMMIRYVNDVYQYFHGDPGKDHSTVIYYVTEIYDNSPGRPDARGLRVNEE
jgi:hypothetical protein